MAIRRLPVIQEPTGDDAEAAARPAWQWAVIGSGLLVTMWTPMVALVFALAGKLSGNGSSSAGPAYLFAATFALSAVAAGYLVARFGPRTRSRHAVIAGLLAAGEICFVGLLGRAFRSGAEGVSALLLLSALSAAFCALGAWLHRRRKSAAIKPKS
jgi:predicted permease